MTEQELERAWQQQEHELSTDPDCRPLALALAAPPAMDLPADFAQHLQALATQERSVSPGFERALPALALLLLACATAVASLMNPNLSDTIWQVQQSSQGWLLWLAIASVLAAGIPSLQTRNSEP